MEKVSGGQPVVGSADQGVIGETYRLVNCGVNVSTAEYINDYLRCKLGGRSFIEVYAAFFASA